MFENKPEILTVTCRPVEFKLLGNTLEVHDYYVNFNGTFISLDSIIGLQISHRANIGILVFTTSSAEPIFAPMEIIREQLGRYRPEERGALDRNQIEGMVSALNEEFAVLSNEVMRRASICRRGAYRNLAVSHVF